MSGSLRILLELKGQQAGSNADSLKSISWEDYVVGDNKTEYVTFFPISDKNPAFSGRAKNNLLEAWVMNAPGNLAFGIPSGSLQAETEKLIRELEDKKVEPQKILKAGVANEKMTVHKVLRAAYEESNKLFVSRWKPVSDCIITPTYSLDDAIQKLVSHLKAQAIKLEFKNGVYSAEEDENSKKWQHMLEELKTLNNSQLRQKTRPVLAAQTHTKNFNFVQYIRETYSKTQKKLEVMQWQAVVSESEKFAPYQEAVVRFGQRLLTDTKYADDLNRLVEKIANKILETHFEKHAKNIKKPFAEWRKDKWPIAKKGVRNYLSAEIPFFNLIGETGIELYRKTDGKLAVSICYPLKTSVGEDVFKFVQQSNEDLKKCPKAVIFVDTTAIMQQAELTLMLPPSSASTDTKCTAKVSNIFSRTAAGGGSNGMSHSSAVETASGAVPVAAF
jgi:hypothetical protein